jgi:phosphoribosylformylglycinamidine (FGAM) synthase PurS component
MLHEIKTMTVKELDQNVFQIPNYQRGFRWDPQQVRDLLNDIFEFDSMSHEKKYCLQPVIVQKKDGYYEVIDGQQRLTTIFIILKIVGDEIRSAKQLFKIDYQTRKESGQFLESLSMSSETIANNNIDYYYMFEAYKTINSWLNERGNYSLDVIDIYSKLLNDTQIIWYRIDENLDNPIQLFTRVNIGRIPLTNSELIKALFLNKDFYPKEYEKDAHEKSSRWDYIEQSLRQDSFWLFLTNDTSVTDTRIDFLFNILAKDLISRLKTNSLDENSKSFSFLVFDQLIKENKKEAKKIIDDAWQKIEAMHSMFQSWYFNETYYHKIGYIITSELRTVKQIMIDIEGMKKSQIEKYIDSVIKKSLQNIVIDELSYQSSSSRISIKRVLLLMNIETMLESKTPSRFPFDLFKHQSWDIEHIHAVATFSNNPSIETIRAWLENKINEFRTIDEEGYETLRTFFNNSDDEVVLNFDEFLQNFSKKYGDTDIDTIENLTLLDKSTNSSYKNSFFPVKRFIIIEKDRGEVFIPVCTKNVFLKMYNHKSKNNLVWSQEDGEKYLSEIHRLLDKYFN